MDPKTRSEICRKGGQAAHAHGLAHQFTTEEARAAGKKGGDSVSRDRAHMARIGQKGGLARSKKAAEKAQQQSA
jgi:general stress protein YciG